MFRRTSLSFLTLVAILSLLTMNSQAQTVMTRQVREVCRNGTAKRIGRLPASQILHLNIVLPLRDPAGLQAFLKALYDPASPSYRKFLTVQQFTDRFGPTRENYDAVVRFAKTKRCTVVGGTRDGMEVQVSARVSAIESALH